MAFSRTEESFLWKSVIRLLLLYCISLCLVAGHRWNRHQDFLDTLEAERSIKASLLDYVYDYDYEDQQVKEKTIVQPLDHFNSLTQIFLKQRYWTNTNFAISSSDESLIYIGGESELSSSSITDGIAVDVAKSRRSLIVAVEHRFYGESLPMSGHLSLENLKYLTVEQALADFAALITHLNDEMNFDRNHKWICIGGSYPGNLCAWLRMKYPDLLFAAVVSSAPVHTKLDYNGYNRVVHKSFQDPNIGGSHKCAITLRNAFRALDKKLQQNEFNDVQTDFTTCRDFIDKDRDSFVFTKILSLQFENLVQYNGQLEFRDVRKVCDVLTAPGLPYDKLVTAYKRYWTISCSSNSWSDEVDKFLESATSSYSFRSERQWLYQMCAQLSSFTTCEQHKGCILSHLVKLEKYLESCETIFKINASEIKRGSDDLESFSNALLKNQHRIIYFNGMIDPWHRLGFMRNHTRSEVLSFVNPHGSHCQEMDMDHGNSQFYHFALTKVLQSLDGWTNL